MSSKGKASTIYITITPSGNPFTILEPRRSFFNAKSANEYKSEMFEYFTKEEIDIRIWEEKY